MSEYPQLLLQFENEFINEGVTSTGFENSGVTFSTDQKKFGEYAGYFNGSSYVSLDNTEFCDGSSDWTIDWWEYRTSATSHAGTISRLSNDNDSYGILFGYVNTSAGTLEAYASNNDTSWNVLYGLCMEEYTLNEWVHRAVVRNGSKFYAFENGQLIDSATSSESFSAINPLRIGGE